MIRDLGNLHSICTSGILLILVLRRVALKIVVTFHRYFLRIQPQVGYATFWVKFFQLVSLSHSFWNHWATQRSEPLRGYEDICMSSWSTCTTHGRGPSPLNKTLCVQFIDYKELGPGSFHLCLTNVGIIYVGGPLALSSYAWHKQTEQNAANRHVCGEMHPKWTCLFIIKYV